MIITRQNHKISIKAMSNAGIVSATPKKRGGIQGMESCPQ
jgi:hypothetical protein